jgi:hypothetical protein
MKRKVLECDVAASGAAELKLSEALNGLAQAQTSAVIPGGDRIAPDLARHSGVYRS